MAGITRMPVPLFLLLDGIGALLFVGIAMTFGWMFQDEITGAFSRLVAYGLWGLLLPLPCSHSTLRRNGFSASYLSAASA
jgi:membrane protein DedA with SNARE-associated domain